MFANTFFIAILYFYATVTDALISHGLHKLCGFSHDGLILEIKVFPKIFHVYQAPFTGLNYDRVIKNGSIPLDGCIEATQGSDN
jgi:hypothetical protein